MKVTPPVAYGFTVALGGPAEPGEFYEVDDELGAQLVAQGWSTEKAKPAKKAAAKKAAAKKAAAKKAAAKKAAAKKAAAKKTSRARVTDVLPDSDHGAVEVLDALSDAAARADGDTKEP